MCKAAHLLNFVFNGDYFVAGLLFAVDLADRERIEEARSELYNIFDSRDMDGVPFVIIANKQDLPSINFN